MKIAEVFVEIKGDKSKFSGTIRGAKRETSNFAASAKKSLKQVSIGLGIVAAAATAAAIAIGIKLTRAIIRAGRAAVLTAVTYDKLKRGLVAVAGSIIEAERQLIRLQKVAELPGLSFRQAIQGSINLQAAGLSAELSERALKAFGNALVTVGKGAEDLGGVSLALTQMANKMSGFGQDVRQLQERLPQMQTALRNAFDGKPLEELEITGKELVAALVTEFEKLPRASGGIANSIENIGISFDLLKNQIGRTLLPAVDSVLKAITDIIDKLTLIVPFWQILAPQMAQIMRNITAVIIKQTGVAMKAMGAIIAAAAPLMFKPLIFHSEKKFKELATGVGLFINEVLRKFGLSQEKYKDNIQELINWLQESQGKSAAQYEKEYTEAIKNVVDTAIKEMPKIGDAAVEGLTDINVALADIAKTAERLTQFRAGLRELADSFLGVFKGMGDAEKNTDKLIVGTHKAQVAWIAVKNAVLDTLKAFGLIGRKVDPKVLAAIAEELQEKLKALGDFHARSDALRQKDIDDAVAAAEKLTDILKGEADDIADYRFKKQKEQKRGTININKILMRMERERFASLRKAWDGFTVGIQRAFTDMFADLLSGQKAKWADFADELKRIFIRKIAEIVIDKAFLALFDLFDRLDKAVLRPVPPPIITPPSIYPEPPPLPASSELAPGAVNVWFPNADIQHMSRGEIERIAASQIEPAFRRLRKRGIIP